MAELRLQIRVSAPGLVGDPRGPIVPAISAASSGGSGGSGGMVDTAGATESWWETLKSSLVVVSCMGQNNRRVLRTNIGGAALAAASRKAL